MKHEQCFGLDDYFAKVSIIVGSDFVMKDQKSRDHYGRSTLSQGTSPLMIIKPKNRSEIQEIIRVSLGYRVQLHTISTGKNWGYSDSCAVDENAVILDLSRMNSILDVNEKMCYVTIEPGVTQGQLFTYLNDNKIPLWMDATGASSDTSIIGNVLERGFGYSPYGDRYNKSCSYEVILPNGEVLTTGFGHYRSSLAANVNKSGIGPSIDGLFTQSNFGIVTKMTIWLMRQPEDFRAVFFVAKNKNDIVSLVDKIRPLAIDGTIRSVVHMSNDLRQISTLQRSPYLSNNDTVSFLSENDRELLRHKYGVGCWFGAIGFYGSVNQNNADIILVKKSFRGIKGLKLYSFGAYRMILFKKFVSMLSFFSSESFFYHKYNKIKIIFELMQGKAPSSSVVGGLWRVKKSSVAEVVSGSPLDHGSGFYWISPILSMDGVEISKMNSMVEPIFNKFGFDFMQTISTISDRSLCAVMTIYFDKHNSEELKKAKCCHDEVVEFLFKNGYPLYRAGNQSMRYLDTHEDYFFDFLKKIKLAIDPNNLFSPGKYIPR
jgi:4-cresol dehydrogenase (hydroxylating)